MEVLEATEAASLIEAEVIQIVLQKVLREVNLVSSVGLVQNLNFKEIVF